MALSLLQQWLEYYDPIHRGWTPAGIAHGVCATGGYFFPRIRGGYNLRRAVGEVPDASAPIVGAAGADATSIRTFPWVAHESATTYVYRITAINGGGLENSSDQVVAETSFDAQGNWVGAWPNTPADLRVTPAAGGTFLLQWTYTPDGEQAEPATFNVYHDNGTGSVDFQNAVATVAYNCGCVHYRYCSPAFAHDTRVRWAVRAESAAGAEETNQQVVCGRADALAPPINPTVVLTFA